MHGTMSFKKNVLSRSRDSKLALIAGRLVRRYITIVIRYTPEAPCSSCIFYVQFTLNFFLFDVCDTVHLISNQ